MDPEQTISEIERLERIFAVPDTRPLSPSDLLAANRRHDDMLAHSPWFRIWQRFGVCCRSEAPVILLANSNSPNSAEHLLGLSCLKAESPLGEIQGTRMQCCE